jgi:hypothetical protein
MIRIQLAAPPLIACGAVVATSVHAQGLASFTGFNGQVCWLAQSAQ